MKSFILRSNRGCIWCFFIAFFIGIILSYHSPSWADFEDEEYREAIERTKEEWNAFRQTMKDGNGKLKSFKEKYEKYKEIAFDPDTERGLNVAIEVFGWDRKEAKKHLTQLREFFNTMDKAGFVSKLKSAMEKLEFADKVAGEIENVWEFAEKFDPAHAEENPTYGLRLMGQLIGEGADKIKKVPLVGDILGRWLQVYADAAKDYANALDRLNKKIRKFRQESLCGQAGMWVKQQKAFEKGQSSNKKFAGVDCLTCFLTGRYGRLRAQVFQCQGYNFIYDPGSSRGFFAHRLNMQKIYRWHSLLLSPQALSPDWIANRANSLPADIEQQAKRYYMLIKGWWDRTDPAWEILLELELLDQVGEYAKLGQEVFVANYILVQAHRSKVDHLISAYKTHVFAAGRVKEAGGEQRPISGAVIKITLAGKTFSTTSDKNGSWEMVMKGKPGDEVAVTVSKEDYKDYSTTGRFPERVVLGWTFSLSKKGETFVIEGRVLDESKSPYAPISGASVSATLPDKVTGATAVSGAGGKYSLTVTADEGVTVSINATKQGVSGSASIVATGTSKSGIDVLLDMSTAEDTTDTAAVDTTEQQWTIQVKVVDIHGKGLAQTTVSGGPSTVVTGAGGSAVVGPIFVTSEDVNEKKVTLTATVVAEGDVTVGSEAVAIVYKGEPTSTVKLTIPVEVPDEVTITGQVTDANGVGVEGATVTGGGMTATTGAGGKFSLGPIPMTKDKAVTLTASMVTPDTTFGGSAVTVTYDGVNKKISGVALVVDVEQISEVTISGRVVDSDGAAIDGAVVSGGGQSAASDAGGNFTLPPFEQKLGKPVTISASVTAYDGSTVSGQTTVTPQDYTVSGAVIKVGVISVPEDSLDDVLDDIASDQAGDCDGAMAEFSAAAWDLDGMASKFDDFASYFDQQLRSFDPMDPEAQEAVCNNADVAYALTSAEIAVNEYDVSYASLAGLYGDVVASCVSGSDLDMAETEYDRLGEQREGLQGDYSRMLTDFGVYKCDEQSARTDAGDKADDSRDPEDIEAGVEVCGDGIDNDGDGEIDECDAGCCDKNVQVTVSDCGPAADDIFLVAVDGNDLGVTPKGQANTFNIELSPGEHSATITCLDDGSEPPGSDVGTACIWVVIFGGETIGGDELWIDYGGTATVGFVVPEQETAPPFPKIIDGSSLQHLENAD